MSHRLQVLVPEELDARISKAATRGRLSKGEWVRRALEKALEEGTRVDVRRDDPVRRLASLDAPTADVEDMLNEIDRGRSP